MEQKGSTPLKINVLGAYIARFQESPSCIMIQCTQRQNVRWLLDYWVELLRTLLSIIDLFKILLTVSGEIKRSISKAKVIKYFKGTATAVEWGPIRDRATIWFYLLIRKPLNEDDPSSFWEKKALLFFFIPLNLSCFRVMPSNTTYHIRRINSMSDMNTNFSIRK